MSLDGCKHLFLDLGSNKGWNEQAIFESEAFLNAEGIPSKQNEEWRLAHEPLTGDWRAVIHKKVGTDMVTKPFSESGLCVLAFDGNPQFINSHAALEKKYIEKGMKVQMLVPGHC